ncbi:MAG: CsbD family protein [Cyanobacteria bacterium P01_D01_bin.1]
MVVLNQRLSMLKRWVSRIVCLTLATVVFFGASVSAASAVGSQAAADVVNERAAAELDRVAGAGTSDQVGGAVDSTVGKAKRGIGQLKDTVDADSATDKLGGAADQLKGEVKRNVGKAKGTVADAADDAEDAAGGVVESIKDFFD